MKQKSTIQLLLGLFIISCNAWSQSPLSPLQGFNVVTKGDLLLTSTTIHGTVAVGNNLNISGTNNITTQTAGNFTTNGTKIGLVVNGQLEGSFTSASQVNVVNSEAYIKIANDAHVIIPGPFAPPPGNWVAWYEDMSGQSAPIRITHQNHYELSFPRISLSATAANLGVSATNNPVFEDGILNTNSIVSAIENRSVSFSSCPSNAVITDSAGQPITEFGTSMAQINIELQNGQNVINITDQQLSMIQTLNFINSPTADRYLIVNITATASGLSNFWNQSGIASSASPYIIYNYVGASLSVYVTGKVVYGSFLAPNASLFLMSSTVHGQVVANWAMISNSTITYQPFLPVTNGCATLPPQISGVQPTANFDLSASSVCMGTEVNFTNTTVVEGCPLYSASTYNSNTMAQSVFNNVYMTVQTQIGDSSNIPTGPNEVSITPFNATNIQSSGHAPAFLGQNVNFSLIYDPFAVGNNKLKYTISSGSISSTVNLDLTASGYTDLMNSIWFELNSITGTSISLSDLTLNGLPYNGVVSSSATNGNTPTHLVFRGSSVMGNGFTLTGRFLFQDPSNTSSSGLNFKMHIGQANCISQILDQPEHPVTYLWQFHDGTTSTLENPVKLFEIPGTHQVVLHATNTYGTNTTAKFVTVHHPYQLHVIPNEVVNVDGSTDFTWQFLPIPGVDFSSLTWILPDGSTQTGANADFTFTQAGIYTVILEAVDSVYGCLHTWSQDFTITSSSVNTGNNGGIESESLGDALSKVMLRRKLESTPTTIAYTDEIKFSKTPKGNETIMRVGNNLTMMQMFPAELMPGDVSYVTSPTDILDFTIAEEVLSVDYRYENNTKGVVLGVRTSNRVYNHTKASCDRLRGAEILKVSNVEIEGYTFLMQAIRQRNDVVEHAISFALAKSSSWPHYTLQTNWYVNTYQPAEQMYNFQVWSVSPEKTVKLVQDILANVTDSKPINQIDSPLVPKTYVSKVWRGNSDMFLKLHSLNSGESIEITFEEVQSETQGYATRQLHTTSLGEQVVALNIHDYYEYDGLVKVNGQVTDAFYYADGNWGLDFVSRNTRIQNYQVTNTLDREYDEDDYLIHRNVTLESVTGDYLILYKSLQPGYIPIDLTDYNFLSFTATGSGMLELGLIKHSIDQWAQQYKANINIRPTENTYYIPLKVFSSTGTRERITADDLTTLTFTFLPALAKTKNLNLQLSDLKFTKTAPSGFEYLVHDLENKMLLYPNPSKGSIKCLAYADLSGQATLEVRSLTGAVIYSKQLSLVEGRNELTFDFDARVTNSKFVFLNLFSSEKDFGTVKIIFE